MRKIILGLFLLLVFALAAGPALLSRKKTADEKLLVISPHWDGIRHEFARAFSADYFNKTGRSIEVVWLDVGGAGEIKKYLKQRFSQAGETEGVGADILFGGGMDMLPGMANDNYFQPYQTSAETALAIPEQVNGQPLRDAQGRYHAACLSGFGFVYNELVLERARLPQPATWEDLGRPELRGWLSCGDPASSGSLHQAFELVLQSGDWESGYQTIGRLFSNVRAFNEGGTSIPRDVSLGQAAVGPCIDFYASAPIRRQGATHLRLVIPEGVAVATPDCIAQLRNAPNPAAAQAFMAFVLSEAGQRLWYQTRGSPGGPEKYDLERLPVMKAIYERGYPTHTVSNPFKSGGSFKYDGVLAGRRWGTLNDFWRATVFDAHSDLWEARGAVIAAGRDADLGRALVRPPLNKEELMQVAGRAMLPDERNALKNKWTAWAREWYQRVAQAARENGPVPEFHRPCPR
jgi:ABC-type Fe3+ transport system substrate-binding protein